MRRRQATPGFWLVAICSTIKRNEIDETTVKNQPVNNLFEQLNEVMGKSGLRGEAEKTVRAAAQGLLGKLDMVARDEFDAQTEVLIRTRARVEELERQLDALSREVEAMDEAR